MSDVSKYEEDADGFLFDPVVRVALATFVHGADAGADLPARADADLLSLEAAAATRTAAQAVERLRSRGADGRGLSSGALDVLIQLSTSETGISVGELARSAGVSPRNATGLLDTLEREELAERIPDRTDRRSVLARITPAGQDWLETFRGPTRAAMGALFRGFTPAELAQLRHLCLRLVENQRRLAQYLDDPTSGAGGS